MFFARLRQSVMPCAQIAVEARHQRSLCRNQNICSLKVGAYCSSRSCWSARQSKFSFSSFSSSPGTVHLALQIGKGAQRQKHSGGLYRSLQNLFRRCSPKGSSARTQHGEEGLLLGKATLCLVPGLKWGSPLGVYLCYTCPTVVLCLFQFPRARRYMPHAACRAPDPSHDFSVPEVALRVACEK